MKKALIFLSISLAANELNIGQINVQAPRINTVSSIDLSESLRQHANIACNDEASTNTAEISPHDFSINAAPFYQNSFLLDGISFSNEINPAGSKDINIDRIPTLPSLGAQAFALDTRLLKSIKVRSHNVSAKYGFFEGGVIDAKLKDAEKPFAASFNTSYTDGNLNKIIIDEAERESYENARGKDLKDNFVKTSQQIFLESRASEDFGVLFSYTRTHSRISYPAKKNLLAHERRQTRLNENFLLRALYAKNNHILKPTFIYAPSKYEGFLEGVANSNHSAKFGGFLASFELFSDYESFNLTQTLGFSSSGSERAFDENKKFAYPANEIYTWSEPFARSGGLGKIAQKQKNLSYKIDLEAQPQRLANTLHSLNFGAGFSAKSAFYKNYEDFYDFYSPTELSSGEQCSTACYLPNGYFAGATRLSPVESRVRANDFFAYLEDDIAYKNLSLRIGARAEFDGIIRRFSLAPRLRLAWQASPSHSLGVGLNRYYGGSLFTYKLFSNVYSHMHFLKRNAPDEDFYKSGGGLDKYALSDLKRPYTDELALFYKGWLGEAKIALNYLKRLGRRQITLNNSAALKLSPKEGFAPTYFIYENGGKNSADIVQLELSYDFFLARAQNSLHLSAAYTKKHSDFADYTKDDNDELVVLDGAQISRRELPDFYDKFKLILSHNLALDALKISNTWHYAPAKNALLYRFDRNTWQDTYTTQKIKHNFRWDLSVSYERKVWHGATAHFGVNIKNLTNAKNPIGIHYYQGKIAHEYSSGRQISLDFALNY